jgi:phage host-nuclease inhibitor protein Gam
VPHKVTKTQENYALPSGKLVFKKQQPEYTRDDAALVEWLKENGGEQYVITKESVDWSSLKATLNVVGDTVADKNGQVIPCISVEERPDVFKVELRKENSNG